jgi:hypothetical protein
MMAVTKEAAMGKKAQKPTAPSPGEPLRCVPSDSLFAMSHSVNTNQEKNRRNQ